MVELFEREDELAFLSAERDTALSVRGCAVVVTGPVAAGKSSLLREFAEQAARTGALPLAAVASHAESGLPLGVIAQLALSPGLPSAERDAVNDLVAAGAPAMADRVGDPMTPDDARVAERFCTLLIDLAARSPLVLVVDDVHRADPASLTCLGYLIRRLPHARIMLVLGSAPSASGPGPDFHLDALRQPHVHALRLGLLSRSACAAYLAARLPEPAADAVVEGCHRASGGNPLLLGGLAEDQRSACDEEISGGLPNPFPAARIGPGYARAVLTCVHRGGPRLLAAARALAVTEDPERRPERLLGLEAESAAAARRELEACGLLADGRFRHPAARAAVLADLDPAERSNLHRRAAELGYAEGLSPVLVAEHLRASRTAGPEWTLNVLREAADQLLAQGRAADAADCLRLAYDTCPGTPFGAKVRAALLRAEWQINPGTAVSHFDDLLAAHDAGHLDGDEALILVRALLWHGRAEAAADVLSGFAEHPSAAGPHTGTELRITGPWLASTHPTLVELVPVDRAHAAHGSVPASTAARRRCGAVTALEQVLHHGPSERVIEEAERILRTARLDLAGVIGAEAALLALTFAEQAQRAAPWCDALLEQCRATWAPNWHARLSAVRGEISLRTGDLAAAAHHARAALDVIPPTGWGVAVGASMGTLVTALSAVGRHDEAAQALTLPVPEAMLRSRFGLQYIRARGRYCLAIGDLDGAMADFQQCGELMSRWNLDAPGLIAWRTDAAETLLAGKQPQRARQLLEDQIARTDGTASPRVHGTALRLAAGTHRRRERPALLQQAVDVLQRSGDSYQLALALGDLSTTYHELGEPRRARAIGRQALGIAAGCGSAQLVQTLSVAAGRPQSAAPASSPASSPAATPLSEAEQRVADLVMLGHTNREIAKQLFVTLSTVEQHLTRAYRKLNVAGRAELALALTAQGEV